MFVLVTLCVLSASADATPIVDASVLFEEKNGLVAVEAEHFFRQTKHRVRAWHLTATDRLPGIKPDGDPAHVPGASGGAYLEALPDTRRTHGDKLVHGQNFQNQAGQMAVLEYKVHINTPGRYYVWARTHSTGTEDNGLHVGIDGTWPASGQRMQWTAKNDWFWDSKQRTEKVHTGVPHQLYLDIKEIGEHIITFSMREDGFEFDRWLMTTDRDFKRPTGVGPKTLVRAGKLPQPFPFVPAKPQQFVRERKTPTAPLALPRKADGNGTVAVSGQLRVWNNITLTLSGPYAHEHDNKPNPFTDYKFDVTFTHESGSPSLTVPGYFAADGNAGNSSAQSGTAWRVHLTPDRDGIWQYKVHFKTGRHAAVGGDELKPVALYDGRSGSFIVGPARAGRNTRRSRDFATKGRLQYVGKHYLKFAGSGEYFIKAGTDAPETLLAYTDFDGTKQRKPGGPLKSWKPHVQDWKQGNPTWRDGRGKGLIGAVNYLAGKGCNAFSFLTYNAGGDGDNVWPFVSRNDKFHYDCSKLDQWGIVFNHAQSRGLFLHFKLQETEMDDNRTGQGKPGKVPTSLDDGKLGPERKLYLRELIARYGHALALNWNLGEENTQSPEEQRAMAKYIADVDSYDHHIVVHTYPNQQDKVYEKLIGANQSVLTGASLQNMWSQAHQRTLKWVTESTATGRPWVVCNDEQGVAKLGVPPDPGYQGFDGTAGKDTKRPYDLHDIRKYTLWGTLMAGGAGVEYYFGYQLPENDLKCEDFRSRDKTWDYCRHAVRFFADNDLPLDEMRNADELVGNPEHKNTNYCFAKPGDVYLVYLSNGGSVELDLSGAKGDFELSWYNPRTGGKLLRGKRLMGGAKVQVGQAPEDAHQDWLGVVRRIAD